MVHMSLIYSFNCVHVSVAFKTCFEIGSLPDHQVRRLHRSSTRTPEAWGPHTLCMLNSGSSKRQCKDLLDLRVHI